ncbi:hypothetical protein AZI86_15560 [Bdellovibrio bacteriovorus]|uniref:Uncharacterized protein n=1 Tax=Bdellovibrio bacteriovorus TaxID=959 RepID=A0A150WI12_BDEBC|nr:hypothetical protein [Bdellovibrio bacteriovorus]KYG63129.1 hypothetical protein AZI86_15560 [Bdellovibrio bacteriovorus]
MLTSKSLNFILMNMLLTVSLVGCNLPSPQEKPENSKSGTSVATFKATADVKKSQGIETQVQGTFALPVSKVFNLVACLKDVAYDKAIQGHEFQIVENETKATSDKEGCITWAEQINFNYLSDSQYILLERTIRGTKLHKGEQKVSFAINPWSHGENLPPVLNPNDGNEIPRLLNKSTDIALALKGFSKENTPIVRPLLVDEGRFFITEQKITADKIVVSVEVHPKVNLQLSKMNGDLFSRPLTSGTFRARLKLIHAYTTTKEIRRLMAQTEYIQATMTNGNLSVKAPMSLPALPTRGQFFLGLELEPIGAPQGMSGFAGVYYISEYDGLKGTGFLKLSPLVSQNPHFKLDSFINANIAEIMSQPTVASPVITDGKKGEETVRVLRNANRPNDLEADIYQKPKIQIAKLDFDFLRVGQEHTSSRQIYYSIKACFRHGLDQKTVRAQTFKITKFNPSSSAVPTTVEKTTDVNSCVIWEENISFDYFACHRYLKGSVKFQNADLGVNEEIGILVNPWETNGNALGRDLRYVDPKEKLPLDCKSEERPRTQIALDGFNYNTVSYRYKIDANLNMTMVKKIQFKMDGRMLVYSSLSNGWSNPERLRDGVYLLRTAIVKNQDYDNNQNTYVASAEKFVNVLSGQVNTDLTYETQDLKALGNRNTILVEIHPIDDSKVTVTKEEIKLKDASLPLSSAIDKKSSLESPTYVGTIILNVDDANRSLRIMDGAVMSELLLKGKGINNSSTSNIIEKVVEQGLVDQKALQDRISTRAQQNVFMKENNVDAVEMSLFKTNTPLVELLGGTKLAEKQLLTKAELLNIISTGQISTETALKLCAFWSKDYWRVMYGKKGGVNYGLIDSFGLSCMHTAKKDPKSLFQIDRQMFVKAVAGSQYVGGVNQGYSVGTSFSMAATHSAYTTRSWAWNTKVGMSKKALDLFSVGTDFGYTMSWATSDSKSEGDSMSLNGVKSLTVQTNTYKIRVNKYQQCAVVRLNPALFAKDKTAWLPKTDYSKFVNPNLSEQERTTAVTRGLWLCDGEDRTTPIDITENYYLINQETSSTGQQDSGDDRNRKFFIALRSTNDFNSFIAALRGQVKGTEINDQVTVESKSIENLFKSRGPNYPGLYRN